MSRIIKGTCPACGSWGSLIVEEGRITCTRHDCPDSTVVADLLDRPDHHVLELGEDGWALQHAITCFPDLLDCPLHDEIAEALAQVSSPPAPVGRYPIVHASDLDLILSR